MCGIVGYIAKARPGFHQREKFLKQGLILDTLRGSDSTGVFGLDMDAKPNSYPGWMKQVNPGWTFVRSQSFGEWDKKTYKFAIGHNRSATVGAVNVDNAHPFQEGPITLVHNGSLTTSYNLPTPGHTLRSDGVDVDSHVICHNLAVHPVDEVVSKLNGAFALVWHDQRDDSINMVRNAQRPLHLGITDDGSILIMSEFEMMYCLTERIGIEIQDIVQPLPGQYIKFPLEDIEKPVIRPLGLWTAQGWNQSRGGNYSGGKRQWNNSWNDAWDDDDGYDSYGVGGYYGQVNRSYMGGTYYPKAQRLPLDTQDNRVKVGGRKRPIPERAQEMLLELDYLVEDRIPIRVGTWFGSRLKPDNGLVSGFTIEDQTPVIIYNVSESMFRRLQANPWLVRPVAIKWLDTEKPAVIAKVVSTSVSASEIRELTAGAGEGSSENSSKDFSPSDKMTYNEWRERTAGGCVQCGRVISYADAPDVMWVNEGVDPLCPHCVTETEGWTKVS